LDQQIDLHKKIHAQIESKVTETTEKINEDLRMNIVLIEGQLKRIRTRKEEIGDILVRILKNSRRDSIGELRENTKKMKQLKKELVILNKEEVRIRIQMEKLNKIVFDRSLEDRIVKASRKSRKLVRLMKKSSRKVRNMRAKLFRNKRLINKLYRSVHETKDVISEKAEDQLEQLKNVRAILKNEMNRLMFEHKKLQASLLKHVEVVKRLSKLRIKNFHKEHAEILEKRNKLMTKRVQVKREKGTEYFYSQLDLLDEKMSDVLREERIYKYKLQKRLNKMIEIAKECEKKTTPQGIEGIKFKCTMCRNLAAYMLQKIRRDRMSRREVMKKMYSKCERSVDPSLCFRTTLKLSTQAFQEHNKDLTPKELCYKVGRCVLKV
jgi:small-conductance mechanosensitive channel